MALQIGDALGDGVRRAFTYSGGALMVLLFVFQVLFAGAVNALAVGFLPREARRANDFGIVFPVSTAAAAALIVGGLLFGTVLYLVVTRALTREQSELNSVPTELFTRRIGRATLSAVGANLVVSLAVLVGFVLLIVPGVFLAISFLFVVFAIGVEDERAVDALRRSWELASGDRWSLLALGLVITVPTGIGSSVGSALSLVNPVVGEVVSLALSSVFSVAGYGIIADAYLQLSDEKPASPDAGSAAPDADPMA